MSVLSLVCCTQTVAISADLHNLQLAFCATGCALLPALLPTALMYRSSLQSSWRSPQTTSMATASDILLIPGSSHSSSTALLALAYGAQMQRMLLM
jgi:hypothetical protein